MKIIMIFGSMLFLLGSLFALNVQPAYALVDPDDETNEVYCDLDGGIWYGADGENGTCYFAPGSEMHGEMGCEADEYVWETYAGEEFIDAGCGSLPAATTSAEASKPGFGNCGNVSSKSSEGAGYLYLKCQKNGYIFYDAGTCAGKCTVSPNLLGVAKTALNTLNGKPAGAMYVKLRDAKGQPSYGYYQVCFTGEGIIYRYTGGAWVAQATSTLAGTSCSTVSGDGNFVLIEN